MSLIDFKGGAHPHGARDMGHRTIAAMYLDDANGDIAKAAEDLMSYLAANPRLADEFTRIGVRSVLQSLPIAERGAMQRERASGGGVAAGSPQQRAHLEAGLASARARLVSTAGAVRSALLDMPYTIGQQRRKLRDWTGDEVLKSGEANLASAQTQARNARFLILVGKAAGARRIGDALTEKEVARLDREASGQ
jgi:hypothetical protein